MFVINNLYIALFKNFFMAAFVFILVSVLFMFGAKWCEDVNKKYLMYTCYAISFITSLPFLIFLSRLFVDTFKKAILFI